MVFENIYRSYFDVHFIEKKMKKVDIAMATYNGESFIEAQIFSIIKQNYSNWCLYISDDASSDKTVQLIKKMIEIDSRIHLVNTERQGGVIQNFNKALMSTDADYIMISDQDDLWPENRLEIMIKEMEKREDGKKNIMLFSDLVLIDEKGNKIADSFYEANRLNPFENMKKNRLLWNCTVYGCTTIVNRRLLNTSLPIPANALMHDQWLALNANRCDGLFYLSDYKTVYYRQHSNNVVGGVSHGYFAKIKNFKKNIKNINKSVKAIKFNIHGNNGLYSKNNPLLSYFDFLKFALKEIFPEIIKGDKKVQALFIFLGFIFSK